ncbi:MAG: hypothetical protein M1822_004537 [Bathelium mastoideum]|nr:MAG: hypothetical protein M1822_004537 [Bathelium mastoideum]
MPPRPYFRYTAFSFDRFRNSSSLVLIATNPTPRIPQPSCPHTRFNPAIAPLIRHASTAQSAQKAPPKPSQPPSPRPVQPPALKPNQSTPLTHASLRSALNPPSTTLPAPLDTIDRGPSQSALSYYWQLGRAYAVFYKNGVLNTRANHKIARGLRQRPSSSSRLTRAERILLRRSAHDVRRIPFFALLFLLAGEWLPLLVPFVPRLVPLTCRIPQQEAGMRARQSAWRRSALRELGEPEWESALRDATQAGQGQGQVPGPRVLPLCRMFGLYSVKLDWLVGALPAVSALLFKGRLERHLAFLRADDGELVEMAGRVGGVEQVVAALSKEEKVRACEDRGMDVLGKQEEEVRGMLVNYLGSLR